MSLSHCLLCSVGDVGVSPVSPREGHFCRGAGPHVDQFVLREKEDRRKREMENRVGGAVQWVGPGWKVGGGSVGAPGWKVGGRSVGGAGLEGRRWAQAGR